MAENEIKLYMFDNGRATVTFPREDWESELDPGPEETAYLYRDGGFRSAIGELEERQAYAESLSTIKGFPVVKIDRTSKGEAVATEA